MNDFWQPSLDDALSSISELESDIRAYKEKQRLMEVCMGELLDGLAHWMSAERIQEDKVYEKIRRASNLLHEASKIKATTNDELLDYLEGLGYE